MQATWTSPVRLPQLEQHENPTLDDIPFFISSYPFHERNMVPWMIDHEKAFSQTS